MYHFDICHTLEMQRVWMSGNARVVFAPWRFRGGEKCVTRLKLHVTYGWPKRHAHHVDVALRLELSLILSTPQLSVGLSI
jgi:hypothetical protein